MWIYGPPMKLICNFLVLAIIRLSRPLSLIFFVFISVAACKQKDKEEITIVWNNEQASGISVPKSLLQHRQTDSISASLQIRLENNSTVMLGVYSITDDQILFKPLIPLTPGLSYGIFSKNNQIGKIKVPAPNPASVPRLVATYPTQDTVPENMLKLYFQFAAPMREGEALKHILLLNNHNDSVPDVFLNLQPELWNKERTVLTVWLDPGRIKRDLIPNREKGNPLHKGQQYTLSISKDWKDTKGLSLPQSYTRKLIVGERDNASPMPEKWILQLPAEGTSEPLRVSFGEALDYFLIKETIGIVDEKGNSVPGKIKIINKEKGFEFFHNIHWQRQSYFIQAASQLEDLAGNNLNRVFDRDILRQQSKDKKFFEKRFTPGGKK